MFKPMLATNTKIEQLKLPIYGSIKLEGVRACFTPDGLKTRPLKKFQNKWVEIQFKDVIEYCKLHQVFIEGEIYKHGMDFRTLNSITRRAHHPDTGELELHMFDFYDSEKPGATFAQRYKVLEFLDNKFVNASAIEQVFLKDIQTAQIMYESAIYNGYEGICFKDPAGTYKFGRSTLNQQKFLRIKPENTYDGVVLEIIERLENLCESEENELGYLSKKQDKDMKAHTGLAAVAVTKCKDFPEPVRVTLSRGLTDQDRKKIWDNRDSYIGKHIRFVGIPVPGMDLPRAPRFDAWRTDLD